MVKFIINMVYYLTGAILGYSLCKNGVPMWFMLLGILVFARIIYLFCRMLGCM